MRRLKNINLWIPVLLIFLCTYIYIFSKDKYENVFSDAGKISEEDWFVYQGEFYVKAGEDVYEKSDFPKAVQPALQGKVNEDYYLEKEENRLIVESEYCFYIYDFGTGCMEECATEYGHSRLRWQICGETIYFVENTRDDKNRLTAYDMALGNVKEIDTGGYEPLQFYVRSDGAVGMWGANAEGDKEYCFLENGMPVYAADKDEDFGWTTLCGFTENGIILEREYRGDGTKIYVISKDGKTAVLARNNNLPSWDNPEAIPEGKLIFEDNRIVAVDTRCGLAKAYDYDLSCMGELQWDIEVREDMEFIGYYVEGDGIRGIWKLADENVYKLGVLIDCRCQ